MTEQKQQHVPSAIDKTELTYWLEEAGKLNSSDYTKDGWDIFRQIVTEATGVKDDATATEHEVSEAVIALIDGMIALEKEKVYTVTVDGKKVAEGVYNQIVTITADASQVGQKFAGWQLKDKIVSYDEVYTFAISGNMAFTATYAPQEQTIEKPLYAAVADTMIIKRADGKANVKYIAKLSIPDNYILNETGLLWYGKPDLENLCTETGPTPGTKKIVAPVISSTYQFAVNVNGIPAGKTIRGVIYAKVTDKETQQTKWVYQMMIKREWRQLLEMIKFSLGKGKAPELRVETDWGKFYRICKFHKIQSMVCPGIQKLPKEQQPPEEILKKFQEAESMEIARDAVQAFSQEELLEAFEKEGISVLPLKGILMKRFYPVTSMRMMADLDILYETGKGKEVEAVLTDLGYYCDHRDSHHDVFFRKPFMNIEMHHCMIGEDSLLDAYYEDIWKRARQEEGKSHIYRLSWEDFYIFMIAHMAKHFQGGGCGIRSIVDMWLFSDRMKESLDWDYVRKELEKIKLAQFERCMCDLVSVWFEEKAETEFYAQLTELLMQSGIYGTITNYNIQHVAEVDKRVWKGQIKVWMEAIFLPYKAMKMQYPYLEKYPVFLPAAWIQRIFRTCFCRKGRAGEVLSGMKVEGNEVRKRQDLFGKLGLS